jgi:two-component system nitrate/nitrite response regulator NarL
MSLFRTGVRNLLVRESDLAVLEAGSLAEAVAVARSARPDMALVDLELPGDGGIETVARLAEEGVTRSIVWSLDPSPDSVLAAIRAGASGFLDKRVSTDGLVRALRGLDEGEAPLSRGLALRMIEEMHGLDRRERARKRAALLSRREHEVLSMVAHGARNREIAETLSISEFTVKRHVQNILQKLGVASRDAAAGFYRTAFTQGEQAVLA